MDDQRGGRAEGRVALRAMWPERAVPVSTGIGRSVGVRDHFVERVGIAAGLIGLAVGEVAQEHGAWRPSIPRVLRAAGNPLDRDGSSEMSSRTGLPSSMGERRVHTGVRQSGERLQPTSVPRLTARVVVL